MRKDSGNLKMAHIKTYYEDILNPANILSLLRIPLAMLILAFFDQKPLVLTLFVLAVTTDALDGYVSRKVKPTRLSGIIDPLCDKFLVILVLIYLLISSNITMLAIIILLFREFFMLYMFIILLLTPNRYKVRNRMTTRLSGKAVTLSQFATILLVLLDTPHIAYAIYAVGIISLISAIDYSFAIKRLIKE